MQSLCKRPYGPAAVRKHIQAAPQVVSQRAAVVLRAGGETITQGWELKVRPYTLRDGDTLVSIAKKRSLTLDELTKMNPGKNPTILKTGDTILLPANKLSSRDKEILEGIGAEYRVYPVRSGEALADIIDKRGITLAEVEKLNPGVNLQKLADGQVIKLPSGKFTTREREMLIGSGILPSEFFAAAKNPFVVGGGALLLVCGFVMAWQRFYVEEGDESDGEEEDLLPQRRL